MVWTPAQTATFLTATRRHRLHALFHLVAHTGLRRGEAVGLGWADLDLHPATGGRPARGAMTVDRQIVQLGWATDTGTPKTAAGHRQVALDPATVRLLLAHRNRQRRERLAAGAA
jgi:integrase